MCVSFFLRETQTLNVVNKPICKEFQHQFRKLWEYKERIAGDCRQFWINIITRVISISTQHETSSLNLHNFPFPDLNCFAVEFYLLKNGSNSSSCGSTATEACISISSLLDVFYSKYNASITPILQVVSEMPVTINEDLVVRSSIIRLLPSIQIWEEDIKYFGYIRNVQENIIGQCKLILTWNSILLNGVTQNHHQIHNGKTLISNLKSVVLGF